MTVYKIYNDIVWAPDESFGRNVWHWSVNSTVKRRHFRSDGRPRARHGVQKDPQRNDHQAPERGEFPVDEGAEQNVLSFWARSVERQRRPSQLINWGFERGRTVKSNTSSPPPISFQSNGKYLLERHFSIHKPCNQLMWLIYDDFLKIETVLTTE